MQHAEGEDNILAIDIWAIWMKLSVIMNTFIYLCDTDKKSPIL